jgi:DNA polymerase-3 subunit epsilon
MIRQVVLDTETTGLNVSDGHRIIEIGAVEIVNRRISTENRFHQYLNPQREIEAGALEVHGITEEFLADKPGFSEICEEFIRYVTGAELLIHNASFDTAFINYELSMISGQARRIEDLCTIVDTLELARDRHPGQKNSLDALCGRYQVNNAQRQLHGALLDAEILAEVYLAMTGGQASLALGSTRAGGHGRVAGVAREKDFGVPLRVLRATAEELALHETRLDKIDKQNPEGCLWRQS